MLSSLNYSRQKSDSCIGFAIMANGNETRDFSLLCSSRSEVNHKMHLTKSTTPTKMTSPRNEGERRNSFSKGDKPQSKAVFFCLSFLAQRKFALCNSIMTALFWQPLRLVVPLHDFSTRFNAVTNVVENTDDGLTILSKGIRYEN